jgi:Arc/MetJ-type ribon-helix-helix transcriptional regulator
MTPSKTFTFSIPDNLKSGLQAVKERDGISEAEQIRRAIRLWLEGRGMKVEGERKRRAR